MAKNSNSSSSSTTSGGIGFTGLLTIAFIILKLCHVISWSWIWVLSPLWMWVIFALLVAIFCGVVAQLTFNKYTKK